MLSDTYVAMCVQVSVTLTFRNTLLLEFYKNMLIKIICFAGLVLQTRELITISVNDPSEIALSHPATVILLVVILI